MVLVRHLLLSLNPLKDYPTWNVFIFHLNPDHELSNIFQKTGSHGKEIFPDV